MQRFMALATLVIVSISAGPAVAQEKLAWKFKEGDKFYVEETATVKQTTKVLGNTELKEEIQTNLMSFLVMKKTADGVVLVQTIEETKIDRIQGKGDPGEADTLEKMRGAKFTITLNNKGQITKFEGYDDFIAKLSKGDAEVEKVLRAILPADIFKKTAEQSFSILPGKAVSKGDTWDREMSISMGPLGSLKVKNSFKYEGKEKEMDVISKTGTLTYQAPKGDAAGLPFKVLNGTMKAENAKGRMLFDNKLGRPSQDKTSMVIRGALTMEILDMQVTVEIDSEQSSVTRVSTKKPGTK